MPGSQRGDPAFRALPIVEAGDGARRSSFGARYTAAMAEWGGRCAIEAGVLGRLAEQECRHGRLPFDRTAACGCWPQEGAAIVALPRAHPVRASARRAA